MTDFDRTSLDRILSAPAGPADWDDVLGRARAGQGRRRMLAVLAAVAAVVVVSASAVAMRAFLGERGFVGLPPTGAPPSTPTTGKLMASYWVRTPETMSNPRRVKGWLYADGRLVWQRENDPHQPRPPEAANRWSSGLVEQRLTRAGVERLRSEIVSTGLFSRNRDLVLETESDPCFNWIDARNDGQLVRVTWTSTVCEAQAPPGAPIMRTEPATREQTIALQRLKLRLSDPAAWLPESSWRQREFKAFVPSRFAIGLWSQQGAHTPAEILAELPMAAQEALRGMSWRTSGFGPSAEVTTRRARSLAKALDGTGLTRKRGAFFLSYRLAGPSMSESVVIVFGPLLPHGEEPGYGG